MFHVDVDYFLILECQVLFCFHDSVPFNIFRILIIIHCMTARHRRPGTQLGVPDIILSTASASGIPLPSIVTLALPAATARTSARAPSFL